MNRRSWFSAAIGGLAWLLGVSRPAVAISSIAYAHADMVHDGDYCYDVTCDGRPLKRCREANAIKGWADCYAVDHRGQCYCEPGTNQPAGYRIHGRIVITARRKSCES